jgi:putative Mg2+ transporter-C (MgtC) family protein
MTTAIQWYEVVARLALAVVAGAFVGLDRSGQGQAAGLRTNLLVCLAAASAMILANLMMGTSGKGSDSFVNIDVMRLPLGVLSGMGFIGAGAIVRRGNAVSGLTTAATLWCVTMMGICLGSGHYLLGIVLLGLVILVLRGLRWVEEIWLVDRRSKLHVVVTGEGPSETELMERLNQAGYETRQWKMAYSKARGRRSLTCQLRSQRVGTHKRAPQLVKDLAETAGVVRVEWSA